MGVPLRMKIALSKYLLKQKFSGRKKYPLVLMIEPLFACNLECAGCGKIQYPPDILRKRLSPEECWQAAEECGAPIVTLTGGEPLLHPEISRIVSGFIERKKFIFFCSNGLLLEKNLHLFKPSPYLTFGIHLDGLEKIHDRKVCRKGVYNTAVQSIRTAKAKGFCVMTNTTIYDDDDIEESRQFFDIAKALGVDGMMISPGYAYEKAPQKDIFLKRENTKNWFKKAFEERHKKKWPFNHSSLYLDFLEGKKNYDCMAWGNPAINVLGWQKPCYLMADAGYAKTYQELLETTDWSKYGHKSGNPKCANCMAHVGFEPTAVDDIFNHPLNAIKSALNCNNHSN